MTIVGFGIILIIIDWIITGIGGGIWIIVKIRRIRREEKTQEVSSLGVSMEMISNRQEEEKQDYRFTPKKVLIYCLIIGLISAILSIFIDGLRLLSTAAFVFASITV